ncbi:signal peptidase II [Deltaproteobacteria bacterium Smac51]|nr:signal peptidase II [Deltaproteobacteria bacterium Smac51]
MSNNTRAASRPKAPAGRKSPGGKGKWRIPLFWGVVVIVLDLATKAVARHHFSLWEPITVIPGFFDLIFTENTGAAFSIFSSEDGEGQGVKMAALAAVSLLPFIYFYVKASAADRGLLASLGLIWGGALGNIHDRFRWDAVVDFLDFHVAGYHWPAFNVADIAICVGAGLLALSIWREKPAEGKNPRTGTVS